MGDAGLLELQSSSLRAAEGRGRKAAQTKPRASRARYDPQTGRVEVDLTNGCAFAFPPRLVQGLEGGADAAIAAIAIPGLMMGKFGARADAAKSGRPRKAG
jgi:hypothetical protein